MNLIGEELLAILKQYLSEPTSRSLLSSAARRASLKLDSLTRADVPSLIRELRPGLNIFLQESAIRLQCIELLERIATGEEPIVSPQSAISTEQPQSADICIPIRCEQDVVRARTIAKDFAKQLGFSDILQTKVATAVSEQARNIFQYNGKGEIQIRRIGGKSPGIQITVLDPAPDNSDPTLIINSAYRSKWGIGAGLRGTKRLVDEFKLDPHPAVRLSQIRSSEPPNPNPHPVRSLIPALFISNETFPPQGPLPMLDAANVQFLVTKASGNPGSTVWPGLFPNVSQKLARLLLTSIGHYDPETVLAAARDAYAPDRGALLPDKPRDARRYHAHDAFACALVHPRIPIETRIALVLDTLGKTSRGRRSRQKTWAIIRFARARGFLMPHHIPQCR